MTELFNPIVLTHKVAMQHSMPYLLYLFCLMQDDFTHQQGISTT